MKLMGHKNSAKLKVTYYKSASTSAETGVAKCNRVNWLLMRKLNYYLQRLQQIADKIFQRWMYTSKMLGHQNQ